MISIRVALACAGAILFFACGWLARGKTTQILDRPVTQIVTQEKVNTVVQQVDHVVTKVVKVVEKDPKDPGKDVETTTTTSDTTISKDTTKSETDTSRKTAGSDVIQRNYSVGVNWQPDWRDPTWVPASVNVGYRVFASAWVVAGYDWKNKDVTLGVRVDF